MYLYRPTLFTWSEKRTCGRGLSTEQHETQFIMGIRLRVTKRYEELKAQVTVAYMTLSEIIWAKLMTFSPDKISL